MNAPNDMNTLKETVFSVAKELADKGPGWAQEPVVLREVAKRMSATSRPDLAIQQKVLTAWHLLFAEGRLSWGYDFDNPNSPFFHVPEPVGV
jgi:hypothetical protein